MMTRAKWALLLVLALIAAGPNFRGEETGFTPLYSQGDPLKQGWQMVGPGSITEESPGVLVTEGGMGMLWYAKEPFKDFTLRLANKQSTPMHTSGDIVR